MRVLVSYFLIGCFIIGWTIGGILKQCPNYEIPAPEKLLATVAIWPMLVVAAFRIEPASRGCEAKHEVADLPPPLPESAVIRSQCRAEN